MEAVSRVVMNTSGAGDRLYFSLKHDRVQPGLAAELLKITETNVKIKSRGEKRFL